jgi:hypothetical protein
MKLKDIIVGQFTQSMSKLLDGGILVLTPKIVFRLKKIDKKIKDEVLIFNEAREQYLKELSNKDDTGAPIIIKDNYDLTVENQTILNEKINGLLDLDFDLGPKIDFKDIEKINLTIKDLIALDGIIADPIE